MSLLSQIFGNDLGNAITTVAEVVAVYYGGEALGASWASTASVSLADTAVSGSLIVDAAYSAAYVASAYTVAQLAASTDPVGAAQASGLLINTASNIAPVPPIYGQRKVGGVRVFTSVGGANNQYLYLVIAMAEGQIAAFDNVYIDDVNINDPVFAGLVVCNQHLGSDTQAADSMLMADLPGVWTTAHQGCGIAYLALKLTYSSTAFHGFPTITADIRGVVTADPRTSPAVLGNVCLIAAIGNVTDGAGNLITSGAFKPTTASPLPAGQYWNQTYAASFPMSVGVPNPGSLPANQAWFQVNENPALCIRDYLTNTRYGKGISSSLIDDSSIMAAANYCDAQITIPGGVQSRYTCNGVVDINTTAYDNLKLLLSACRGYLVFSGGKYKLQIDQPGTEAFAFTEDNITGNWTIATPGRRLLFNRVNATFYDPAQNWQPNYAISDSTAYRTQDNGLLLDTDLNLPFTSDSYTALRLAGLQLKQSRFGLIASFTAFQEGLRVEVGDVVSITHSTPGWVDKLFRVASIEIMDTEEVKLVVGEYDVTAYALDTLTAITATPALSLPSIFSVPTPASLTLSSGTSELLTNNDGTLTSRIKVLWPASSNVFVKSIEVQFRVDGTTVWQSLPLADATQGTLWVSPVIDGTTYDIQARFINVAGQQSGWLYSTHTVVGKTAAPSNVTSVTISTSEAGILISWPLCSDADYQDTILEYGSTWGTGIALFTGNATSYLWARPSSGTYNFMVKNRDTSGNLSVAAASASITYTAAVLDNSLTVITAPQFSDDHLIINNAGTDIDIELRFNRTTGGSASMVWNGAMMTTNKPLTPNQLGINQISASAPTTTFAGQLWLQP